MQCFDRMAELLDATTVAIIGVILLILRPGVTLLYRIASRTISWIRNQSLVSVSKTDCWHHGSTHRIGYAELELKGFGVHLYLSWISCQRSI